MKNLTPDSIKNSLLSCIDHVFEDRNSCLVDPLTNFSRTQKISFRDAMLFPIVMSGESTSVEMLDYFSVSELPSQAAMIYRRSQIRLSAFQKLFTDFSSMIPQKRTFHGMRLIACDGTRLNTPYNPDDSNSFVQCVGEKKGFNQYHLNTCYDVLNDIFLDAVIQGYYAMNEKRAFCQMLDRFPKGKPALFTADRGYASYNVISHAKSNGHHFVIRLTGPMARNIFCDREDIDSINAFDIEDDIHIGRVRGKYTKNLSNYHYLSNDRVYDSIIAGEKKIDHFHLRLVKFELQSGISEYLLTDLSKSELSFYDLKEVYRLRWGIETSYRFYKYAVGMDHIHSLKPAFIFQEIYAKLICYDFCAAIINLLNTTTTTKKHKYTLEKTYLIKVCIRFLKNKIDEIEDLVQKKKVPERAGRRFDRNIRRQHADTLQYR